VCPSGGVTRPVGSAALTLTLRGQGVAARGSGTSRCRPAGLIEGELVRRDSASADAVAVWRFLRLVPLDTLHLDGPT
jgi:hypothetical protein